MKLLISTLVVILFSANLSFGQTTTTEDNHRVEAKKDSAGATVTDTHDVKTVDDVTPRDNMIVINPLKFFVFYNLGFVHKMSEHVALGGSLQTPSSLTGSHTTGFGVEGELRYYFGKHNLRGFYVAPNFSFNALGVEAYNSYDYNTSNYAGPSTYTAHVTAASLGVLAGWQWFPGDDFAMGLGIGIDRYWFSGGNQDAYVGSISSFNGLQPSFRFDIGYGW